MTTAHAKKNKAIKNASHGIRAHQSNRQLQLFFQCRNYNQIKREVQNLGLGTNQGALEEKSDPFTR